MQPGIELQLEGKSILSVNITTRLGIHCTKAIQVHPCWNLLKLVKFDIFDIFIYKYKPFDLLGIAVNSDQEFV